MAEKRIIIALNKSDLQIQATNSSCLRIAVSALNGTGIAELVCAIVAELDSFQTRNGVDGIAISARHSHALAQAKAGLSSAIANAVANEAAELLASDLRDVLNAYSEIVGRIDNERMLDQLFANFCIGK